MKVLCKKYSQCIIAILMMTVLYGKSVICVTYDMLASKYANAATDTGETPQDSNETEKDSPLKGCKKACPDMEYGQTVLAVDPLSRKVVTTHSPAYFAELSMLSQKVPTPPPLHLKA